MVLKPEMSCKDTNANQIFSIRRYIFCAHINVRKIKTISESSTKRLLHESACHVFRDQVPQKMSWHTHTIYTINVQSIKQDVKSLQSHFIHNWSILKKESRCPNHKVQYSVCSFNLEVGHLSQHDIMVFRIKSNYNYLQLTIKEYSLTFASYIWYEN